MNDIYNFDNKPFRDSDGNPQTLYQMIRIEPDWVHSRFIEMLKEIDRLKNDLLDALDLKEGKGPTALAMLSEEIARLKQQLAELEWRPIDTAPKGENGIYFMRLRWGPDGDKSSGDGIRIDDKYYASGTFFCHGQKDKPFELREIEVFPTDWMPTPASPTNPQGGDGE